MQAVLDGEIKHRHIVTITNDGKVSSSKVGIISLIICSNASITRQCKGMLAESISLT